MEETLDGSELAHLIVGKLEEHQAADILMLDLREITPFADYFVICTADSDRQADRPAALTIPAAARGCRSPVSPSNRVARRFVQRAIPPSQGW